MIVAVRRLARLLALELPPPRSEVNRWRAKYVDERARLGVAGFAAYHFRSENSSEQVMKDTLAGLARGLG